MGNDTRPRWRHKCPACNRTIFWEYVYCMPCIRLYPERDNFRLRPGQSRLKNYRLTGIKRTVNHLYVVVKATDNPVCVECGHVIRKNFKHRCARKLESFVRLRVSLKCSACKMKQPKENFSVVARRNRKDMIRVSICNSCLSGAFVVNRKESVQEKGKG